MSKYIQAWVGFRKPMVMQRKMREWEGIAPRFQTAAIPSPGLNPNSTDRWA